MFTQKIHTQTFITATQMFITAPLIIFKEWEQSKSASVGESISCGTSAQYYNNKKEWNTDAHNNLDESKTLSCVKETSLEKLHGI